MPEPDAPTPKPRFLPSGSLVLDAGGGVLSTSFDSTASAIAPLSVGAQITTQWPELGGRLVRGVAAAASGAGLVRVIHQSGVGSQLIRIRTLPDDTSEVVIEAPTLEWNLREHFEVLDLVSEHATDAIQVWRQLSGDPESLQVTFVNPAWERLTGFAVSEILGRRPYMLSGRDASTSNLELARESVANAEEFEVEIALGTSDGREVTVEVAARPVFEEGDAHIYWVVIQRDVSARKARDGTESLRERLAGMRRLAGAVAHSYNNTIMAALADLELARVESNLPVGPAADRFAAVERHLLQIGPMSNRLILFSASSPPERRPLPLTSSLRAWVAPLLEGTRLEFSIDAEAEGWVLGDSGQLRQLFGNLVRNALTATEGRGRLTVAVRRTPAARRRGESIVITLTDSGPGIAPEILPRIFEPYFSAAGTSVGLGLSVAWSIAHAHEGTIAARSISGGGAEFTVIFPAHDRPATSGIEASSSRAGSEAARAGGNRRLLIMDDEPTIRSTIRRLLERRGYVVEVAADGDEAVRLYREAFERGEPHGLLIFDAMVQGGKGGEAALQEIHAFSPTALAVIWTGYSSSPVMSRYREAGFVAALSKPFAASALYALVDSLVAPEPRAPTS